MSIREEAYDRSPAGLDISSHSNWVTGYIAGAERYPWQKWSDGPPTENRNAIIVRKGRHLSVILIGSWCAESERWEVYNSNKSIESKAAEWMYLPFMVLKS